MFIRYRTFAHQVPARPGPDELGDRRPFVTVANAGALGVLGPNAGLSEMVHGSAAHERQLQAPSWTKCAP
ncbi:hypothetical protein [Limosilactobacillus fermentum]